MAAYAADGSLNITIVDGNTYTGRYATDGSTYAVVTDGSTYTGLHHRCGAMYIVNTNSAVTSIQHPSGGVYVSDSTYANGSIRVTVISGALEGGGSPPAVGNPMGLLLALTYAA